MNINTIFYIIYVISFLIGIRLIVASNSRLMANEAIYKYTKYLISRNLYNFKIDLYKMMLHSTEYTAFVLWRQWNKYCSVKPEYLDILKKYYE